METNKIILGDAKKVLKTLPAESIDMCITSPPYWALRDYGKETEEIWDGDENCKHKFNLKHIKRKPVVFSHQLSQVQYEAVIQTFYHNLSRDT